jgi:hypothetical protein
MVTKRIYMTDRAARLVAMRDAELNPEPNEAIKGILQRMDDLERAVAILVERDDSDGPAGTTTYEPLADNDDESGPRNIEVLNAEITPGALGHVYSGDDFPSPASINERNSEFWSTPKATPTVSVMGNPGPAPGNENSGRGQNYMPGAARSINNARRLSTTARSLDLGKTGSWSTDGVPNANFYRALDQKTNSVIGKINAANARAYGRR